MARWKQTVRKVTKAPPPYVSPQQLQTAALRCEKCDGLFHPLKTTKGKAVLLHSCAPRIESGIIKLPDKELIWMEEGCAFQK